FEIRRFMSSGSPSLVQMKSVTKSYGALSVLKNISLEMSRKERVVVIGPSGGGKSTLLRVLMGLENIDSGNIVFDGQPYISNGDGGGQRTVIDTKVRRMIGMVFQHYT